jgi:hypothetical protein
MKFSKGVLNFMQMMIGIKRPYPFSMDFSQAPALNYRMPHSGEISTNARISYDRGSGFHFDAGSSTSRLFSVIII